MALTKNISAYTVTVICILVVILTTQKTVE
ncbi:hypothetical protein ESCOMMO181M_23200 [Escherichia coli]